MKVLRLTAADCFWNISLLLITNVGKVNRGYTVRSLKPHLIVMEYHSYILHLTPCVTSPLSMAFL